MPVENLVFILAAEDVVAGTEMVFSSLATVAVTFALLALFS